MTDVQPVASILLGYRVMRGTADGARYVRELLSEPGSVEWTSDRDDAVLFDGRSDASRVQEAIVARERRCVAVVPHDPKVV